MTFRSQGQVDDALPYPSGHLVPSPILGLANAPIVETKFLELAMSLLDISPRIPIGTFSILLWANGKTYPSDIYIFSSLFMRFLQFCRTLKQTDSL